MGSVLSSCFQFGNITVVSHEMATDEESVEEHFRVLDIVLYRLAFHGWKLNIEKISIAEKEIVLLGWHVKNGKITADPKRIKHIVEAEFPTSRKALMSFVALVSSLRRIMPAAAAQELAKLYELTSVTKEYMPTETHRIAFEKCKKYLTSEPLFVHLPDANKVKVLFSDCLLYTSPSPRDRG